ncbi:hypothetical protein RJT34_23084 [Clitoria ternatea]|uniref:Uncharacterized protein n=1 Tax=Clitoria ternatea TaxID=43366 RepID=A0AAN9FN33_CLITE
MPWSTVQYILVNHSDGRHEISALVRFSSHSSETERARECFLLCVYDIFLPFSILSFLVNSSSNFINRPRRPKQMTFLCPSILIHVSCLLRARSKMYKQKALLP